MIKLHELDLFCAKVLKYIILLTWEVEGYSWMMWDALVLSQDSSTAHTVVLECTTVATMKTLQ